MRAILRGFDGTEVAIVEVTEDDCILSYDGRFFTPVNFLTSEGRVDWKRLGSEFAETSVRAVTGTVPT